MIRRFIILLLGVIINLTDIYGQITLESCQEKARNNYPLIKQFGLIDLSQTYSLSNAGKGYLPQVTFSAKAHLQSDVTEIPPALSQILSDLSGKDVEFTSLNKDQYQLIAEISQVVWDGGAINSQKNVIKATGELERKKLEVDMYSLRDRVNQIFFGILALNEQLIITDLLNKELDVNHNRVSACIENGIAARSDLDLIRIEQLRVKQKRAGIIAAQKSFRQMLTIMTADTLCLTDSLIKPAVPVTFLSGFLSSGQLLPAQQSPTNMSHGYDIPVNRPELAMLDAQYNLYENQKGAVRSSVMPKVGIFAQGGYGNPGLNMFEPGFTPYYILGARVVWNFGGLYTKKTNIRNIEVSQQNINLQKETFLFNTRL
ncbi:MAG: TolC family protein, partial [Bacteroidales bacterium]|nr:TolC family protein [Bacteroidales bacterium]